MNGGWTEYVLLWTFFKDSFETYKTFPWCIITEFECKVDVGNHKLGTFSESVFLNYWITTTKNIVNIL